MSQYVPVWTTHHFHSEGGRKIHLMEAQHVGQSRTKAICKRKIFLANTGDPIPDLEKWLTGEEDQVCKLCVAVARNQRFPGAASLNRGPKTE